MSLCSLYHILDVRNKWSQLVKDLRNALLVFTARVSAWGTVALAFGVASLAGISTAVTPTLLLELAGSSRTTATGCSP